MKQCQEFENQSAPISQTRVKLIQAENATVRDTIDHLRDDGMLNMAKAVEDMLTKYEAYCVQEIVPHTAGKPVSEVR